MTRRHATRGESRSGMAAFLGRATLAFVVLGPAMLGIHRQGSAEIVDPVTESRDVAGSDTELSLAARLTILGEEDANLYKRIFALQNDGKWQAADKLTARLSDRRLMGYVLYQRYMHPRAYRATYAELKDWMANYADHVDAERIYRLATKRRPKNWNWPRKPVEPSINPDGDDADAKEVLETSIVSTGKRYNGNRAYAQRKIRRWIKLGAPTRALNYLQTKSVARHFDDFSYDEALANIGGGYFQVGMDEKALEIAGKAAGRSGALVPESNWWAGLAAWRLDRYDVAAAYFEALGRSNGDDKWLVAGGGYWAARAYLIDRQPAKVIPMLRLAARYPLTFYGVISQESLGIKHITDWSLPEPTPKATRQLMKIPAAQRSLALFQVGHERQALAEIKRIAPRLPQPVMNSLMAYADDAQVAALAYEIGNTTRMRDGRWHNAALYPVPSWTPSNGFQIDRALIFGLMRQESSFKVNAKSHAGARGLMQLMPGTAGFISGRRYRGWKRELLYEPELNVTLGQKYIRHLLETDSIGGNLFFAVAAYNGGPGNLRKWRKRIDHRGDPLLFIESIPNRETRVYVERVMANVWLYRDRLGQPRPSLDQVVAGEWPVYSAFDPLNRRVAFTGVDRD